MNALITIFVSISVSSSPASDLNSFFSAILNHEIDPATADWTAFQNAANQIEIDDRYQQLRADVVNSADFPTYASGRSTPLSEMPCLLLSMQAGRTLLDASSDRSYAERRAIALPWLADVEEALAEAQAESTGLLALYDPARDLIRHGVADQYWRYIYQGEARSIVREYPDLRQFIENVILHRLCVSDRSNAGFLRNFVRANGWPTDDAVGREAVEYAWLILQHADIATQEEMLPAIRSAADDSMESPQRLARLIDRMRVRHGRPQLYGTQWSCRDGVFSPYDIETPESLDERRASVGLSAMADIEPPADSPDCLP